jgi:leukotriene-A4 hydrolase
VWAEPELLDACYWEFSEDTGRSESVPGPAFHAIDYLIGARFLSKEEDIVGPYKFGVYDVLILPPSFPYGGMVSRLSSPFERISLTGLRRKTLVSLS